MKALRLGLLFAGFGLLPLWSAVVVVVIGDTGTSDYWAAAPWLIVAAIPACVLTLAIAGITYTVYRATKGDPSAKLRRAAGAFGFLVVAVLMAAGIGRIRYKDKESDLAAERQAAQGFVENNEEIQRAAPASARASLHSATFDKNNVVFRYTFSFYSPDVPDGWIKAVLDVDRSSGQAVFKLRCIISKNDPPNRKINNDPCP
jgi:hypothetical protein